MNSYPKNLQGNICEDRRFGRDRRGAADIISVSADRRSSKDRRNGIVRREHKRFQVIDFTFVKLRSKVNEDIGQLLDLSHGGLSLRYFATGKKPRNFSELDILLSGGDFAIKEILFITVSDIEMDNNSPLNTISFRRYGMQFEYLTPDQKFKLDYFLLNHTSGGAYLKKFIR